MRLSGILFTMGWVFSFLATTYGLLFASLDKQWLKESFLNKFVADPFYTLLAAFFFGLVASASFVLSYHVGKAEGNLTIQALRADIVKEFSSVSQPIEKQNIQTIIELRGMSVEKFMKLLSNGTESDQGLKLLYEKDYIGAITKFTNSIQGGQKDLGGEWLNLGNAYFLNNQYSEASVAYENATKNNPRLSPAWSNWGAALMKQGLNETAIEKFKQSETINNRNEGVLINWGATLAEQGKHKAAIQKFEKALNINSKSCKAYFNWGVALGAMGNYKEAAEKYQKAVTFCPQYAGAWLNYGWCLEQLGDFHAAIKKYKTSLKIRPHDA